MQTHTWSAHPTQWQQDWNWSQIKPVGVCHKEELVAGWAGRSAREEEVDHMQLRLTAVKPAQAYPPIHRYKYISIPLYTSCHTVINTKNETYSDLHIQQISKQCVILLIMYMAHYFGYFDEDVIFPIILFKHVPHNLLSSYIDKNLISEAWIKGKHLNPHSNYSNCLFLSLSLSHSPACTYFSGEDI